MNANNKKRAVAITEIINDCRTDQSTIERLNRAIIAVRKCQSNLERRYQLERIPQIGY